MAEAGNDDAGQAGGAGNSAGSDGWVRAASRVILSAMAFHVSGMSVFTLATALTWVLRGGGHWPSLGEMGQMGWWNTVAGSVGDCSEVFIFASTGTLTAGWLALQVSWSWLRLAATFCIGGAVSGAILVLDDYVSRKAGIDVRYSALVYPPVVLLIGYISFRLQRTDRASGFLSSPRRSSRREPRYLICRQCGAEQEDKSLTFASGVLWGTLQLALGAFLLWELVSERLTDSSRLFTLVSVVAGVGFLSEGFKAIRRYFLGRRCPSCHSRDTVPVDSPAGMQAAAEWRETRRGSP